MQNSKMWIFLFCGWHEIKKYFNGSDKAFDRLYLDNNGVLYCVHTDVPELQVFAREIFDKVPTFQLLQTVKTYVKICTKLVPHIKFVDEFDILVGTK